MKNARSLVAALASLTVVGAVAVAALTVPSRSVSAETPQSNLTQVKALYTEKCQACHQLSGKYDPLENGYTRADWQRTVMRMMQKQDSSITPADAAQIISYLGTLVPKTDTHQGGRASNPWATDTLDVWTDAPAATRVFNFAAASPLSGLSPLGSGTSGPAPVWQVATDKAGADGMVARVSAPAFHPDRFALLVDRADQGRNLDVRVRFRIESGKASPAVGIAFGLADPDHYTVLRCNQTLGDLALIQIAGPTHTIVQQTPLTLPATPIPNTGGAGLTSPVPPVLGAGGAAPTPLSPGWHTLRLLVKDGQVRGWLDMQKRISTTLPGYAGGKVGLWTQGNTVASFHDWIVDWYDAPKSAPLS